MKFKINTLTLSDKLGLIQGISERRATMPILSHVLIIATSDKIKLSATDLETAMITLFDADIKKEGGIALPARKLYEILKEVPLGEIEIQEIRLVATDGHRLSLVDKRIEGEVKIKRSVVVPRKGVTELRKLVKLVENINIGIGKNDFIAEGNGITLNVRLIDAEFPNYKQVIPEATQRSVEVRRDDFLSALRRVSIISSERTKGVKISLDDGNMTLVSVSPELGEAREVVPIKYKGDSIEFGFNARYLIDVLEVIISELVQLGISDELSPLIIRPIGDEEYISVIMPMRV